jgi:hypothetical protein
MLTLIPAAATDSSNLNPLIEIVAGSHGTALVPWAFFAMDYPGIRT